MRPRRIEPTEPVVSLWKEKLMLGMLAHNWWVLALRGLFAIIFGVLALIWPGLTLFALIMLFGAYALVDGIFAVIAGIASYGHNERWWAMLLGGVAGILVGLLTFFYPGTTALVLVYFIAAWALLTGILGIAAAIRLRKEIEGEWMMILSGILSIIFGVFLIVAPGAGALGLTLVIGAYAIVFGILLLILAFRLRGMPRDEQPIDTSRPSPV
jgi:uncharacterized membrane protein HdeD (DUF308 family)